MTIRKEDQPRVGDGSHSRFAADRVLKRRNPAPEDGVGLPRDGAVPSAQIELALFEGPSKLEKGPLLQLANAFAG